MKFNRENIKDAAPKLPDFQSCEQIFSTSSHSVISCYQHGILAACACVGIPLNQIAWLEGLVELEDVEPARKQQIKALLEQLYTITCQQFESVDFDFQLLLPDDSETLSLRLKALGFWCKGFIMGLKAHKIHSQQKQVESCKEPLEDISQIAEIDYEQVDTNEESEKQYLEIYEHVRILVITVYFDLAELRAKKTVQ